MSTPPTPGPLVTTETKPAVTDEVIVKDTDGADATNQPGTQDPVTAGEQNQSTTSNQQSMDTDAAGQEADKNDEAANLNQQQSSDSDADLTAGLTELKELSTKAFHYSGITDTLDRYIEVMNGRRIRYSDGAAQQKALANIFRTLLRVSDELFQPALGAVLSRFKDNLGDDKCFNELKRSAHLIDPASTSKKPVATFSNKEEYVFFNNMMALFCQIADPKGRREVLNRINVEAVFAPIQKDKSLTHGINRFVEYLREQR